MDCCGHLFSPGFARWVLCGVVAIGPCVALPPCPCKPSKSWASLHRLADFSTKSTVACREGRASHAYVRACVCALVPFLEATLCSFCAGAEAAQLLGLILLGLDTCYFFFPPATIKTHSSTVATSYSNSQCLCLSSLYHNILGCYWLHKKIK